MEWRDDFDLPRRWGRFLPPFATEILVAAIMVAAAVGLRLLIDRVYGNVAVFALIFPAVAGGTLLAGPRSGAMVIAAGQLLVWYFLMPPRMSFQMASPDGVASLLLTTGAEAMLLWSLASYRDAMRRSAILGAERAAEAESRLESLSAQARLDEALRKREEALAELRQNLTAIYDASADGLTLCRAMRDGEGRVSDYQVIEVNKAHGVLTGATREQMLGLPVSRISPPVDPRWFDSADQAISTGTLQQFDVESPPTSRWLNIRVSRVSDTYFQQTFVDVTDRHRLEDQRRQMLKEMSHRVMNNLQLVASFLHIQGRLADPAAMAQLKIAESRVQVLAKLHSLLAYAESDSDIDGGVYFGQLCDHLAALIDRPQDVRLDYQGETLMLSTDRILPLGLVISELVTNAVKYAFPPPCGGLIEVTLARAGETWTLTVRDNGRGMPGPADSQDAAPPRGGLGTRLVHSFVRQIGGEMVTTFESGTCHVIRFTPS